MLTIKKRRWAFLILAVISVVGFTGCGPPGPRDLRKGERLIEQGQCAEAVPILNEGVQLLRGTPATVQAHAWNLLGLAYHGAGQGEAAARAYLEALKLDRNLWAADYNMGCLRLEQTNFPGAIDYLNTYTTSHPRDVNGFLILGRARLKMVMEHFGPERTRQVQLENARLDYEYAEKLRSTAEACNALGVIELQRHNPGAEQVKIAMEYFKRAMQRESHYPPALLNMGIVLQRYLNEPREALETYRQFLALQPPPAQAREVERLANQLDLDSRITMGTRAGERPAPPPVAFTNSHLSRIPAPVENPAPRTVVAPPVRPAPAENSNPPLQAQEAPVIRPPPQSTTRPPPGSVARTTLPNSAINHNNDTAGDETPPAAAAEPKKSTLLQKINPIHWFSGKSKKANPTEVPIPSDTAADSAGVTPIPSDRKLAEQLTRAGRQAEHKSNRSEAMRDYQNAMKADPTYFEPALALGLTAIDAKAYPTAMNALSQALALRSSSADARYAFAWVLGKQGFYQDGANELDKLLSAHPDEVRAHVLLGNFYEDNLGQPKLAREQYTKALELIDPQSAEGTAIQAWLDRHPQ